MVYFAGNLMETISFVLNFNSKTDNISRVCVASKFLLIKIITLPAAIQFGFGFLSVDFPLENSNESIKYAACDIGK